MLFIGLTLAGGDCRMFGMKKYIACFIGAVMLFAAGIMAPANAYVDRNIAVVAIMNKAAGKTQTVRIPVGRMVDHEKLSMMVRACKQTDPFQAEDYFMFIEIYKPDDSQIFGNWMSRNEPGDNPLQDADYDVWLIKCENGGE